ncbi:hypothetical protein N8T08_003914 [Aspergillus melleus]|uniref:Uncharacterized protein n=1 Tax=Aspergillus melleus TaxID=138277 RepID=A0ACC3B5C8_9EURO|nr:hypothetical protein N8T08_003914 [Aspergillus melleus]
MRVPKNVILVVNHQSIPVDEEPNYDGLNTTLGIKDPLLVVVYAELGLPGVWPTSLSDPLSGIGIQKVTKCALSFCAREYDISVSRGTPSAKVLDEDFGSFYTDPFLPLLDQVCWKPSASPISDWPKKDRQMPNIHGLQHKLTDQPNFEFYGAFFSWIFKSEIVSKDGSRAWKHDTSKDWYKSTFEIKRVNDLGLLKLSLETKG